MVVRRSVCAVASIGIKDDLNDRSGLLVFASTDSEHLTLFERLSSSTEPAEIYMHRFSRIQPPPAKARKTSIAFDSCEIHGEKAVIYWL
jgi:hypothetical protein